MIFNKEIFRFEISFLFFLFFFFYQFFVIYWKNVIFPIFNLRAICKVIIYTLFYFILNLIKSLEFQKFKKINKHKILKKKKNNIKNYYY